MRIRSTATLLAVLLAGSAVAGCFSSGNRGNDYERAAARDARSGGGLAIPGFSSRKTEVSGIGVNAILWRAALETIDFMPLDDADPYGGIITTEWYANAELPDERFKVTVYILDSRLRADAINVSLARQTFDPARGWTAAPADSTSETQIENAILTRARQIRIETLEN